MSLQRGFGLFLFQMNANITHTIIEKGGINMILFTMLLIVLIGMLVSLTIAILAGVTGFLAVFGDIVIFGLIIWLIVKLVSKNKNKGL